MLNAMSLHSVIGPVLAAALILGAVGCTNTDLPATILSFTVCGVHVEGCVPGIDTANVDIDSLPPPDAAGGSSTVTVTAIVQTSCPAGAGELRPTVIEDGRSLTLEIEWQEATSACAGVDDIFLYEAILGRFPPGTYTLRVIHFLNSTSGNVIFEGSVLVA